jgi:hypothetical protein
MQQKTVYTFFETRIVNWFLKLKGSDWYTFQIAKSCLVQKRAATAILLSAKLTVTDG